MLREVDINDSTVNHEELKRMFDSAFSEGEQWLPYDQIIHIGDFIKADLVAYYDKDMLLGLSMIYRFPKYNFGCYFTIKEELRNKGYGKKIFDGIISKYSKDHPFIIGFLSPFQKDAPNIEIRKRRYSFFLRNGMKDTGVNFTDSTGTYVIMSSSNETFTEKDREEIFALITAACEKCIARK